MLQNLYFLVNVPLFVLLSMGHLYDKAEHSRSRWYGNLKLIAELGES